MSKNAKANAVTRNARDRPIKEWPEPAVPADLKKLSQPPQQAKKVWMETTPMAIGTDPLDSSTKEPQTRTKRIAVACSKLKLESTPCCFNRSMCCEPAVSKNGVLLEPK